MSQTCHYTWKETPLSFANLILKHSELHTSATEPDCVDEPTTPNLSESHRNHPEDQTVGNGKIWLLVSTLTRCIYQEFVCVCDESQWKCVVMSSILRRNLALCCMPVLSSSLYTRGQDCWCPSVDVGGAYSGRRSDLNLTKVMVDRDSMGFDR